jgi:cytochrome c oxidase cbb3-type subunit 4
MYKFITQYAETIKGVQIYALFSMVIFLVFFIVLLYLVKKMDKQRVIELSNIPLDDNELTNSIL